MTPAILPRAHAARKICFGMLLLSLPVFCGIFGTVGLSKLMSQADAVIVATVDGHTATGAVTIDLTVQRDIKGSIPPMRSITAELSASDTGKDVISSLDWELPTGKAGIWFLKRSGSAWRIMPLVMGDIFARDLYIHVPAGELPASYRYDPATDPKMKFLLEVEPAAVNPATSREIALLAFFKMFDEGLGTANLKSFNAALASSSELSPRAIGIAGQVRAAQPGSIAKLVALSRDKLPLTEQGILLMAVCDYRGTEPAAIPELANLAESSPVPRMQECAAHALREVHTKETLPAGHKIETMENYKAGPDVTQEMYQHYPAMDLFAKDEGEYISYWKAWLNNHR